MFIDTDYVRTVMMKKNVNQKKLAKLTSLTEQTICTLFKTGKCRTEVAGRICRELDINPHDIMTRNREIDYRADINKKIDAILKKDYKQGFNDGYRLYEAEIIAGLHTDIIEERSKDDGKSTDTTAIEDEERRTTVIR